MFKKRFVSTVLCASLILSGGALVYGAEEEAEEIVENYVIVPDMNFTGATINLSLADAVKRMQTEGLSAETAEINKQSDEAIVKGYSESARSIAEAMRNMSGGGISASAALEALGANTVNQKAVRLRRDFAEANLENNYQAEMNKIETETVSLYYNVLLAQDQLKAAQDNLKNYKDILSNTQKKYDLGTAAKIDLTSAEIDIVTAEHEVTTAQKNLTLAKMSFNNLLGYSLMQSVNFTDTLKELDAPTVTLKEAIEKAKANRLEIKGAVLAEEVLSILLDHMRYTTATSSATYKQQQILYLQAQQATVNAPIQIEMDVRSKYSDMTEKKSALDSARATLSLAEESYRLSMISYEAGMNTLTDVQEAQLLAFRTNQAVAKAMADYDLAIYEYNFAQGVGMTRINLASY